MKLTKIIGLIFLICITFFYTEKVMTVTMEQDEIMLKIKEYSTNHSINPTNATINNDTIIPGTIGKYVDISASYKAMKKINYYDESLIIYKNIYPEVSIYNNYHKYIIKGNTSNNSISLIYIINNSYTIDNIINTIKKYNIPINFFIDSSFLNNNINIIDTIKNNEIYNYGKLGTYTKDNLIITNNIINNKANNKSIFCLFINKDSKSLNNCADNKMFSIIPKTINTYNLKSNLNSGNFYLIENSKELNTIIEYILSKGYNIIPLSDLITE